jgi:hypothetical protein
MYLNWRAGVVVLIVVVAGYFAYQKLWVGGVKKIEKTSSSSLLKQYEKSETLEREMIYRELKKRAETPGKLSGATLRPWLKQKEKAIATYQLAAEMMGRLRDRKSAGELVKDLKYRDARVRIGATKFFEHAPCQRAIEPMIENLKHTNKDLAQASSIALESASKMTGVGVRYKSDVGKWKEWWKALSKGLRAKIPQ